MAGLIVEGRSARDLDFVLAVCREKVRKGELTLATSSEIADQMAKLRRRNDESNKEIEALKVEIAKLKEEGKAPNDDVDGHNEAADDMIEIELEDGLVIGDSKDVDDSDSKDIEASAKTKKSRKKSE